jgi:pyruvate dehydrogenase E1 component
VPADIWSVTSFGELRREALSVDRWNDRHPDKPARVSYVEQCFNGVQGPFVAATDYMKIVSDQIREWVPGTYTVLGTDGFGRSDSRAALREFFEVDSNAIVVAALKSLSDHGALDVETVTGAIARFGIDPDKQDPVTL